MHHDPNRTVFKTTLGWAGIIVSEQGVRRIILPQKNKEAVWKGLLADAAGVSPGPKALLIKRAIKLLQAYFSGRRVSFGLQLDMRHHTLFQQAVWLAAAEIPRGETRSYAWIAMRIRNPRAVRAVGRAMGANPLPIIIPCHRVISSAGTPGGFSGGLGMKMKLLALEEAYV